MGLIRAAFTSLNSALNDAKFKEFMGIATEIEENVLAIKGQIYTQDPDGKQRQSNKTTGLLNDGSLVFIPQGYVAIVVNNGQFLVDMAVEPGVYVWDTNNHATMFFNGQGILKNLKSTWTQFKDRFQYGGQVVDQQEVIYIKTQPITGIKFGTQNSIEFMSPIYRNMGIRFYGMFDMVVSDPITFYIQIASRQFENGVYHFDKIGNKLRLNLPTTIGVALSKLAHEKQYEIPQMNTMLLDISEETATSISSNWNQLYGLSISTLTIQDISYDEASQKIVAEMDNLYRKVSDPRIVQYELAQRQMDALNAMAKNEAKGESMNAMAGFAMMPAMMSMMNNMQQFNFTNPQQPQTNQPTVENDDPLGIKK